MKAITISIFLIFFLITGCDNGVGPSTPKTSGEVTINSNLVNLKGTGFSFSLGDKLVYPNSSKVLPDIIVLVHIAPGGNVLGVFFASGSTSPSFNLVHQSSSLDSAQVFFNNLTELPESNYSALALPVKKNQIWAIKTIEGNYTKILILDTIAFDDTSISNTTPPFGEAKFQWMYQHNGSRKF